MGPYRPGLSSIQINNELSGVAGVQCVPQAASEKSPGVSRPKHSEIELFHVLIEEFFQCWPKFRHTAFGVQPLA